MQSFDLPNTVDHVLAANRFINKRNQVFSQVFNSEEIFSGDFFLFAADDFQRYICHFISHKDRNRVLANRFINKRNQVFSQVFNSEEIFSGEEVDFKAIQEEIINRFANALKTPKEMAATVFGKSNRSSKR